MTTRPSDFDARPSSLFATLPHFRLLTHLPTHIYAEYVWVYMEPAPITSLAAANRRDAILMAVRCIGQAAFAFEQTVSCWQMIHPTGVSQTSESVELANKTGV
jgi:hypothetical protein